MAFPTITPQSMQVVNNTPTRVTTTLNGVEQRLAGTGQYFSFVAEYRNLSQSQQRQILGHMASVKGGLSTFTLALPPYLGSSTAGYSGSITTSGTTLAGALNCVVTGTPSTAILKAGDLIKFAGANKLYMVTDDVTTGAGGTATVNFFPALRTTVAGSTAVAHTSLSPTVRYASDNLEFSIGLDLFPNITLQFIEVL